MPARIWTRAPRFAIAAALVALVSWVAMRAAAPRVCGYEFPGTSPLFAQQSASLRLDERSDEPIALWPTGEWPGELRLRLLDGALAALDAGETTLPVVDASARAPRSARLRRPNHEGLLVSHIISSAPMLCFALRE